MNILAIDPGSKKVGYIIMNGREVIAKGVIPYKDVKHDVPAILRNFTIDQVLIEKGGVPQAESVVKQLITKRGFTYIQYDSVDVREKLDLFDMGIDNQNKKFVLNKLLGLKLQNGHIIDAALLIAYHNILLTEQP